MKQKTKNIIAGILIIGIVIGIFFVVGKSLGLLVVPETESNQILYPLYSSICCKDTGQFVSETLAPTNSFQTYICPTTTTQCQVYEPTINCAWYQDEVWQFKVIGVNGNEKAEYHNTIYPFNSDTSTLPQIFNPGDRITYAGACFNIISIQNPLSLLSQFSSLPQPASSTLNVEYKDAKLWYQPAGEAEVDLPNTNRCSINTNLINSGIGTDIISNSPESGYDSIADQSKTLAQTTWYVQTGNDINQPFIKQEFNEMQLFPGAGQSCYQSIDKWVALPEALNKNPKGQYQSKDVICSLNKGIIALSTMQTDGGSSFLVPTERLTSPTDFCCADQDCIQRHGVGWACESNKYSCAKTTGYCNSDLDCQPMWGLLQDNNCYMTQEGKFFTWSSTCSNHACSSASQVEVKCCASYCNKYGQVCDYQVGCKPIIPPIQPCPAQACCDQDNAFGYIAKTCNEGLQCCGKNAGVGACKVTCENGDEEPCASCWVWLKDKMGIQQDCDRNILQKIWDGLKCPFFFLKLALILISSLVALLFSQQFADKTFRNIPYWATWIIAILLSGLIGVLAYMFLEWYYVIPVLLVLFVFGIIVNAIPGGKYIMGAVRRR